MAESVCWSKSMDTITVNGETYQKVNKGNRAVIVVDRGWIFAGDVSDTKPGFIRLDNALHVFRWESCGFPAMVADPKKTKADLRDIAPVEIPAASEIFRIPVCDDWGK